MKEQRVSRQHGKHRHVSKNTLTPMRKKDREQGHTQTAYLDMLNKAAFGGAK